MRRLPIVLGALLALSGCSMIPRWVPFVGTSSSERGAKTAPEKKTPAERALEARLEKVKKKKAEHEPDANKYHAIDDSVSDRVVAVVNNDAITEGELLEAIAAFKAENRDRATASTDDLAKQFLTRLIDSRLQLQEADREKVIVDDAEVTEELTERIKKMGIPSMEQFKKMLAEQGVSMDAVTRRVRENLRMAKVARRKVGLRVSVTEPEIDTYLSENRAKLETGLSYHARHILIAPEGTSETAWTAARQRADEVERELAAGGDFAELARKYSVDASAKDGGDLGALKRGELAQDIEQVILALQPGQISAPHRSSIGYHIFRLESKESLEGEGLVRVRQQIRDILFREKYEARFDAWLKEVKQRAIIEIRM